MKTFFMDLEFLCDELYVDEDAIIAICVLSESDDYELCSLVQPDYETYEVSSYCTNLTGITSQALVDQPYFEDLYDELIEKIEATDEILVWGNTDLEAVYKASVAIAGELEFLIVDFQQEFKDFCGIAFRPGLKKVYEALTDDFEAKHHDVRTDTMMLREIYRRFMADKKAVMRTVKNKLK